MAEPRHLESFGRRVSPQTCAAALILIDLAAIAGIGAPALRYGEIFGGRLELLALAPIAALYVLFAYLARVHTQKRIFDARHMLWRTAIGILLTFALVAFIALGTASLTLHSLARLAAWGGSAFLVAALCRYLVLRRIAKAFQAGRAYVWRVLSVGVRHEPIAGDEIALRNRRRTRTTHVVRVENIEDLGDLSDVVARHEIDRIYVTSDLSAAADIPNRLQLLHEATFEVFVPPVGERAGGAQTEAGNGHDFPAVTVIDVPLDLWRLWLKRLQDLFIAALVLILAAPLLLALAAAIKVDSRGPILSRCRRTRHGGADCELWTFRSTHAEAADRRMTSVGRFMLRTSLDRLPLFFNVLQGRLSIVGPRPYWADMGETDALSTLSARYAASHRVNPGLTGLAQVEGLRGEQECALHINRRVALDWAYIEKRSIWLDLTIMTRTVAIVVRDCLTGACAAP
jgi:putative colanic acid biosynthesis UDP-glucose lipid carrier transferase